MPAHEEPVEHSAHEKLAHLMSGYWYTQAIYVAAELRLADHLADAPRTVEELARPTGTHARSLYRLLRALASVGIFAEDEQHRFSVTPMAECLRSDSPQSLRAMAIMRGTFQYEAWGRLLCSIRTGRSAFETIHGTPIFEYLSQHPEQGKLFDAAMTGVHGRETAAMLDAFDFTGIGTLADIGGGNGSVLTAVLQRYPAMRGVLFDLPAVTDRARTNIDAAGLSDRCTIVAGNFFEDDLPAADAYLMRHIIHDWTDEQSIAILRNCRKAMTERGRLLVVEGVVPTGNEPSVSKFFDLAMMVIPGGLERTEAEYRELFRAAGMRLTRIVPTKMWISVLEGVPE
jgi:hypothetical protein